MGAEALHREWTGYADLGFVFVGPVVEVFGISLGSDGGINLFLTGDAGIPPVGMNALGFDGPGGLGFAGDLPFLPGLTKCSVQLFAQGLQGGLPLSQIVSISVLLAIDFRVIWGTRS